MSLMDDPIAQELQAESDRLTAKWAKELERKQARDRGETEQMAADRERIVRALRDGGYARITAISKETGKHLCLKFSAKRKVEGKFVSRRFKNGRVGLADADRLFVDHGDLSLSGWVGSLDLRSGEWREPRDADHLTAAGLWAAKRIFAWAHGADNGLLEKVDLLMALECHTCGRTLTDPESIERGEGPECFGRRTGSKHA